MTELEKKQDELIRHFNNKSPSMGWYEKKTKLEVELAALKQGGTVSAGIVHNKAIEYSRSRVKEHLDSGTLELSEDEIDDIILDFERGFNAGQQHT